MKLANEIAVFAPATVANVACGFDILSLALESPGDVVRLVPNDSGSLVIKNIEGDQGLLPREIDKNAVTVVIRDYLKHIGIQQGIDVYIKKQMLSGSGLGSSAASAVAAGVAINALFENRLTKNELLPLCINGEEAACGSRIADNVSASLFGGINLIQSYEPLQIHHLPVPEELYCAVIHPHVIVLTKEAREILPKDFPLKNIIKQTAFVATFVAALYESDYKLLANALQDVLIEPYRKTLIPHFDEIKNAAYQKHALGCSISGSGPSVFALCKGNEIAETVGQAMLSVMKGKGIETDLHISKINKQGAIIL